MGIAFSTMGYDGDGDAMRSFKQFQARMEISDAQMKISNARIEASLDRMAALLGLKYDRVKPMEKSDAVSDRLFGESIEGTVHGEVRFSATPSPQIQETSPEEQNLKENVHKPKGTFIEHLAGESAYDASPQECQRVQRIPAQRLQGVGKQRRSPSVLLEFQNTPLDRLSSCIVCVLTLAIRAGTDEKQRFESGEANRVWKPGGLLGVNAQLIWLEQLNSVDDRILQTGKTLSPWAANSQDWGRKVNSTPVCPYENVAT